MAVVVGTSAVNYYKEVIQKLAFVVVHMYSEALFSANVVWMMILGFSLALAFKSECKTLRLLSTRGKVSSEILNFVCHILLLHKNCPLVRILNVRCRFDQTFFAKNEELVMF